MKDKKHAIKKWTLFAAVALLLIVQLIQATTAASDATEDLILKQSKLVEKWGAFRDYVRDLSWLETKQTAVLLQPYGDASANKTYSTLLDILDEASNYWKGHKVKFDVVVFR